MPAPRISIRPAGAEDREAVLAFSQNTFDWGDYLPFVWDDWLNEPSGKFLVATIKQRPVAVARVAMLSPTEAWLEGLRVDPTQRRQGIAMLLTRRCLKEARAMGAGVIRFVTASTNHPIHALGPKLGFEKVISLTAYRAAGTTGAKSPLIPLCERGRSCESPSVLLRERGRNRRLTGQGVVVPRVKDMPRLLAFLKESPVLAAMGGLCKLGWTFQTLTEQVLKERLKRRRLRMVEQKSGIGALAITGPTHRRRGISVGYLDGKAQALDDLITGLRAEAARGEPPELTVWVPEVPGLKQTLFEAGFRSEAGRGSWVYEKEIGERSE